MLRFIPQAILAMIPFLCAPSSKAGEPETVRFEYQNALIWIRVEITGSKNLNFLFDSGAEQSVIDLRTAKNLGIRFLGREEVRRVDRDELAYQTAPVRLELSKKIAGFAPLLALDLRPESRSVQRRIDGLIGTDFMAGRVIRIDYRSQRLALARFADREARRTGGSKSSEPRSSLHCAKNRWVALAAQGTYRHRL